MDENTPLEIGWYYNLNLLFLTMPRNKSTVWFKTPETVIIHTETGGYDPMQHQTKLKLAYNICNQKKLSLLEAAFCYYKDVGHLCLRFKEQKDALIFTLSW